MTLTDIKDYLKAHIKCDNWYAGKIDAKQEYCIGVFPTQPPAPVVPIGGLKNKSYATKSVSVLVHWGKQASPAEAKAQEIFSLLFGQNPAIAGHETIKLDFRTSEPVGIGTDDLGVYEYVINFVIYYKKEG